MADPGKESTNYNKTHLRFKILHKNAKGNTP